MSIAQKTKEKMDNIPVGSVFTIADFEMEPQYQPALVVTLGRMVKQGIISKVSKGKYYKPKQSIFGTLLPATDEIVKDFLQKSDKTIGYVTGTRAFAEMGLTTQISSTITVGTNKYRGPLKRGEYQINFLLQPNPIREEQIPLLRILDAVRLIKRIPAISPDECVSRIGKRITALPIDKQGEIADLALAYAPYVRALTGAILEQIGTVNTHSLRLSLNGVTSYKLSLSEQILPNKRNWNIL
ncbi:MAG: hypothetical protein KBS70_05325 [Bacteroidales bacterium]|nr:hypothetical protein [Candidatus Colicola equi]